MLTHQDLSNPGHIIAFPPSLLPGVSIKLIYGLDCFISCCQTASLAFTATACARLPLLCLLLSCMVGMVGTVGTVMQQPEHWGITSQHT